MPQLKFPIFKFQTPNSKVSGVWRHKTPILKNNVFFVKKKLIHIILWEALDTTAHSEKSINVSDVNVTDEDDFLSHSMMIKAKNIIMKERTWINRVAQRDVTNCPESLVQFEGE